MPKIKEETGTITTQVKAGITPNRTNLLGATQTKGIRTPRGATTTSVKGKIITIFEPTSLVPFAVNSIIILIISPKSLSLNE
jgi:hypothetical protein